MEKRDIMLDSQSRDQTVHRTPNGKSSLAQAPVDVGRRQIISELTLDFRKEQ